MTADSRLTVAVIVGILVATAWFVNGQLPAIGAGGLLHPGRQHLVVPPPASCEETTFAGAGVSLKGWSCRARSGRRATLVYLHGIADNRASSRGVIDRYLTRGFDVIAFDGRAHGESGGDVCTYGYFEKDDLHRVLDVVAAGPIVLFGTSLGAAVALQEAADDARVGAIVAAEIFSDLRTVATERAPFFFTSSVIAQAFHLAERRAGFQVDAVSPVRAASRVRAPVLLIHGAADKNTLPDHSRRVFAALRGSKRLMLVPGAGHNGSLRAVNWTDVDTWIDEALGADSKQEGLAPES